MILESFSSFKEGDRVQIVLEKINLDAGAGDEYPHMGMGTVIRPLTKDGKLDIRKEQSLRCERLSLIHLDIPHLRIRREKTEFHKKGRELVMELTIPWGILKRS